MKLVSVIIPKTPHEDIKECLDSIKESTYKNIEVIVVDEGLERSKQRNIGIKRAKGKYLLFLDADQFVSKGLIADCVSSADYGQALYIPEIIVTPGWFGRLRNWERQFYTGTEIDCVKFVRNYDCPMFDESMSGPEDSDWDKRIGDQKVVTSSCLYHRDNVTVKRYFQKKAYYSRTMGLYAKKWPDAKILNFRWRCWTVFTERGKWRELLKHPIKAVGMFTLIFLRGVIYLWQR